MTGDATGLKAKLEASAEQPHPDIDNVDARGYTAYHQACGNDEVECVRILVQNGCCTDLENLIGLTGWGLAKSVKKDKVCAMLKKLAVRGHLELQAEMAAEEIIENERMKESAENDMSFLTVKIEVAHTDAGGEFTAYVVQVESEGKQIAVVYKRYSEFTKFRAELLKTSLTADTISKLTALPFPKKTLFGKNTPAIKQQRSMALAAWMNAVLAIAGKIAPVRQFLELCDKWVGITIFKLKKIEEYSEDNQYMVTPVGACRGLATAKLPERVIFAVDEKGVQLYNGNTKDILEGEAYAFHLIRYWAWNKTTDTKPGSVSLTFGSGQNDTVIMFSTPKGQEICATMKNYALALASQVRAAELNNLPTPELKAKLSDLEAIKQKCEADGSWEAKGKLRAEYAACNAVLGARRRAKREDKDFD